MAEDTPQQDTPRQDTPQQDTPQTAAAPRHRADPPGRPATKPSQIDMSAFEELFAGPCAPDRESAGVQRLELPAQQRPGVEWAVLWSDGRVTRVHSESAARFVADRYAGCRVTCRIVGPWRPA